ncbi:MAG: hypothetical protein AMXMBFR75_26980 [Candidatus Hinthialibacteria bacterium]|nr:hypothetical protein [bacterium]MCE7908337.1 hypothetical protein [Candidatus Omnitrophica bacterium COP1]
MTNIGSGDDEYREREIDTKAVIPTKVGIQKIIRTPWIPAFARVTNKGGGDDVKGSEGDSE